MAHSSLTRTAVILTVTPGSVAVAAPLAGYGSVGSTQNMWTGADSGAQGMAWAYSKDWLFHAIQIGTTTPSGYTIAVYGTVDPRVMLPASVYDRDFSGGNSAGLPGSNSLSGSVYGHGSPYFVQPSGRDGALRLPIATHVQNGDVNLNANSWVQMPSPSDQGAIVVDYNPITAVGQMLYTKRPLLAVRVVLIASATPVGSLAICVTAV